MNREQQLMTKGWKFFDLMHKNRKVARIYESGKCTIYFPSFMPYNLYLEKGDDFNTCINNLNNFYYWCSSRILTLDRKYAKEILNSIGAIQVYTDRERAAIAVAYRALSLMDVYWVRAKDDNSTFEEISLYHHSLSNAFVDVSLRGKQLTLENAELITAQDQAGDIGTPGVAPKAWIRDGDGNFYLLKDGDERDVDAEILASRIIDCFDIEHVVYKPSEFDGTSVSKCRIDIDKMEFVLKKDSYSYYMMNIIDYLIGNVDRHWGNWGFEIDNATNKLGSLYPLMDFNKAFLSYDTIEGAICQTTTIRMTQQQAAIEAVRIIGLNQIKEIDRSWFADEAQATMFFERLSVLKEIDQARS